MTLDMLLATAVDMAGTSMRLIATCTGGDAGTVRLANDDAIAAARELRRLADVIESLSQRSRLSTDVTVDMRLFADRLVAASLH
ncbi:hypothetical protein WBP07_21195 (plasmid) [Novosphingobium sp. BL-8A]|uniref:hypothetical protein n=1 Tax=Novosphingobium sp. BL-8A TaxID=3127639 RepID=UPI00375666DD